MFKCRSKKEKERRKSCKNKREKKKAKEAKNYTQALGELKCAFNKKK